MNTITQSLPWTLESTPAVRPEFAIFAAGFGISEKELHSGIHSLDSMADDEGEKYLPQVVEKMAAAYLKTDELLRKDPDSARYIDQMQEEAARLLEQHPGSMDLVTKIFEHAELQFGTGPLPGGFTSGEEGIFAAEVYEMDWKHSSGLFAMKLGEVLVDTSPSEDGLVYFIHRTGTPDLECSPF